MSLINCPECSHTVSNTALNCPQCGVRLRELKRGFWGQIFKWAFILFNFLMVFISFKSCSSVADLMSSTHNSYAQAGATIGFSLGMGALVIFWASVDIILGLFVFFTRPQNSDVVLSNLANKQERHAEINKRPNNKFTFLENIETVIFTLITAGIILVVSVAIISGISDKAHNTSTSNSNNSYPYDYNQPQECDYLSPFGINTGSYKDDASEEYEKVCFSNYIGIGDSKQNDMAYYAYGSGSKKIEKVVLTLGITEKYDEESTLDYYKKYIGYLFKKYTGTTLSKKYLFKIKHHQPFSTRIGSYSLSMEKNGDSSQYGLVTEIKKIK